MVWHRLRRTHPLRNTSSFGRVQHKTTHGLCIYPCSITTRVARLRSAPLPRRRETHARTVVVDAALAYAYSLTRICHVIGVPLENARTRSPSSRVTARVRHCDHGPKLREQYVWRRRQEVAGLRRDGFAMNSRIGAEVEPDDQEESKPSEPRYCTHI
jgi:hypothetical protein